MKYCHEIVNDVGHKTSEKEVSGRRLSSVSRAGRWHLRLERKNPAAKSQLSVLYSTPTRFPSPWGVLLNFHEEVPCPEGIFSQLSPSVFCAVSWRKLHPGTSFPRERCCSA